MVVWAKLRNWPNGQYHDPTTTSEPMIIFLRAAVLSDPDTVVGEGCSANGIMLVGSLFCLSWAMAQILEACS